ncbi:translation elongation factor Ts [Salinisphaera sp.]|uniref:translation elongation factor Ts n=1 Tax=Salinisphaera sp. TaxID=1914330 RepID=UPI000C4AE249|nr:translation elongation factor Ts [Salinisphaera sp.]MAS11112.1 elongation factor Ts [Salinisphaera sp.]|tara:strand:+ start:3331 stop:4212 length:882 start_codon:yes stop_codon:yes gene_type:complete
MAISAALVKELRERTGAGMMECKKALTATDGDIDAAADNMRREGLAKADKKAGRVAAEGRVATALSSDRSVAILLEVNCETDFVGKNDDFVGFAEMAAQAALDNGPADVDALAEIEIDGESLDAKRRALVATLGENITIRRFRRIEAGEGKLDVYMHGSRIGSAVAVAGGEDALARDLAMHVAATAPAHLSADDVPQERRDSEKELLMAQARDSGKPEEIIEKMVEGRLRKFLGEITLMGQPFVKDPDMTVEKLCKQQNATIIDYARIEVGEGIEKKQEDFAAEVKAQAEKTA